MHLSKRGVSLIYQTVQVVPEKLAKMKTYALLENGSVHTDDLDKRSADEMLERHSRIFPNLKWEVVPTGSTNGIERLKGLMDRQRDSAVRYNRV